MLLLGHHVNHFSSHSQRLAVQVIVGVPNPGNFGCKFFDVEIFLGNLGILLGDLGVFLGNLPPEHCIVVILVLDNSGSQFFDLEVFLRNLGILMGNIGLEFRDRLSVRLTKLYT